MKKNRFVTWALALAMLAGIQPPAMAQSTLQEQFCQMSSEEAKPWTFWYWMFGAVTKEGITADLEAMKRIGLGGTYLMPIKSVSQGAQYQGKAEQLTPEWWEMVRFSMQEADRLGLKLGMHICDGFALAGGPWITPEESMQKVVFADTIVQGGKIKNLSLPKPESYRGYYEDIALYAIPVKAVNTQFVPKITCSNINTLVGDKKGVTIDEKGVIRSSSPCWIQYEFPEAITCRNVEIILTGNNYQAHRLRVMASNDGIDFRFVKQLQPARQGWQNTDENSTHTIPPTTARFFRFYWTPEGSEPGCEDMDAAKWKPNLKIKQIRLHSEPRINQWEGKAALVWRVAKDTPATEVPDTDCVKISEVINLMTTMKNGYLTTVLPKGKWRILRMGHTSTGHDNATGGGGKGLECNKFDAKIVRKQFDNWFGKAFTMTDPALARRVLKYMHVDSWECGCQNWSNNFVSEFKNRRGYDLMPYMPLLAGIPMETVAKSEQVLRDVRTTCAELVKDVFYDTLAACAKEFDCQFSAECVAPTMVSDGLLHYQKVDFPMGEFWLRSPTHDKPNDMLDAISGGHIYGKRIIQAEGFTEVRGTWDEAPSDLKALLDRNYALGINRLFFHVTAHNPWLNRKPGMTLDGIGLFFQRDNTWYDMGGKALVDYIRRAQTLLQYGYPVTDIAVFTGEEMPRRSVLPDRLVPMLPGIFGRRRVESEHVRLANVGEPLRTMPVGVTHSANMADPEKWVNPLRGYAYDSFNRDALLRLVKADNTKGVMRMPWGSEYRVLVVPESRPMMPNQVSSPEVEKKLKELYQAGVLVVRKPYFYDSFSDYGLDRDVVVPEGVAWTHRRGEEADIYFIANQNEKNGNEFMASFRISGMQPELWNPMTGEITEPGVWREKDGRVEVRLDLEPSQSMFVVFRRATSEAGSALVRSERHRPMEVKEWNVHYKTLNLNETMLRLTDWTRSSNERVRHYSGTAVYSAEFKWKAGKSERDSRVFLKLGTVHDVAAVRINGMPCGTVWTAPYEVDVTSALKKGKNIIEIEVVNTWANALLGADQGKAPFDGIWTNGKYRRAEQELIPAGLIGPLEWKFVK